MKKQILENKEQIKGQTFNYQGWQVKIKGIGEDAVMVVGLIPEELEGLEGLERRKKEMELAEERGDHPGEKFIKWSSINYVKKLIDSQGEETAKQSFSCAFDVYKALKEAI